MNLRLAAHSGEAPATQDGGLEPSCMKITKRRLSLAWKYRRQLWRYRSLIRNRRAIATSFAVAGTMLAAGVLLRHKG